MEGVAQPSGTVTLVFTDIEGSTRLLTGLGRDAYHDALMKHRHVVRDAFGLHGGYEVDTQGDSGLRRPDARALAQNSSPSLALPVPRDRSSWR
jgi:class 3 adenylate cyclase